jgi:hypothetical protein
MRKRIRLDEAFEQRLQGQLPAAPSSLDQMAKLAEALRPATEPQGPGPQFRARLRNELLARAAQQEADEAESFAAMLEADTAIVPAELRPLVAVASALKPERLPEPAPAFRYQLRNHLVAAATPKPFFLARAGERIAAWNTRMRRSMRLVGATGLAVMMMLGASAALAMSQDSYPGDILYPVKRFHEGAQLMGTSGEVRATKLLGFARVRLHEVDVLVERGERDSGLFIDTLNDMDELTIEGRDLLLDVYRTTRDIRLLEDLESFAREQASDLKGLFDRLPPGARPVAQDSLTLVESIAEQTGEALAVACEVCPEGFSEPLVVTGGPTGEQVIGCACEQTDGNGTTDGSGTGNGTGDDGGTDPGDDDPTDPTDPVDDKVIDIEDPTGNGVDEPAETIIDDLLDGIGVSPSPVPSLSDAPVIGSTASVLPTL